MVHEEKDRTELNTSGSGLMASNDSPEHANKHSSSIKSSKPLGQLSDY
jgi:hypothetical protein